MFMPCLERYHSIQIVENNHSNGGSKNGNLSDSSMVCQMKRTGILLILQYPNIKMGQQRTVSYYILVLRSNRLDANGIVTYMYIIFLLAVL